MNYFIRVGGGLVILAVFGIFLFILGQILPLFTKPSVEPERTVELSQGDYLSMAIDEWGELPVFLRTDDTLIYYDLVGVRGRFELNSGLSQGAGEITARHFRTASRHWIIGTADGRFRVAELGYRATFAADGSRSIEPENKLGAFYAIGREGAPIIALDYADSGSTKLAVAIQQVEGRRELHAATLVQRRSLMGAGKIQVGKRFDLTSLIPGVPRAVLVSTPTDTVLVTCEDATVHYLVFNEGQFTLRQSFRPFAESANPQEAVARMDFVLGDVTAVFAGAQGSNRSFALCWDEATKTRLFKATKHFEPLPGESTRFSASMRNKAFLLAGNGFASLRYNTTESVRWESRLPYDVRACALGPKYDRLYLLDAEAKLHVFAVHDPHPEASFQAFFGKIWYEGQPGPDYLWQSTGGSDDFEPKLSLIPLISGSLKGTFFALLFAVPIALLAAIYASQFLSPETKRVIKPMMEIMASLPSVVLGFLGALWLAPLIDTRVPSLVLVFIGLPVIALGFGTLWTRMPPPVRMRIQSGTEVFWLLPVLILAAWGLWSLGPVFERLCFVVTDPTTGKSVADFRLWWPEATGTPYVQRNSLVVGFVMGFAVIPLIFTIAEDAMSNVPYALRSASLALGASRWQTALRVVLPTAASGVFSALMIGLGRAVGETMIVVMATGNTPIMDLNIFTGMRTLSANIAVELPEAPHGGTLFRTLFLGAMVLFLLTFLVNTAAEVLRQRLRERYKTVE